MAEEKSIKVIGLMSGTSLDGLDICFVEFSYNGKWSHKVVDVESVSYSKELTDKLATAQSMSALEYAKLDVEFGHVLGKAVKDFIDKKGLVPDIIASHGQTIFHQPSEMFTAQIGSGACIAAETMVDTVCDFRTTDVALSGQGAPLVPIGDKILFGDYDACLNLGGFSNISMEAKDGSRIAYDICAVNYVLNHYTRQIGLEYDKDGEMARSGKIDQGLLEKLDSLPFFTETGPKSLGREWVEEEVFPLLDASGLSIEDKLSTFCEHVARQIAVKAPSGNVLVTGGGALNKYLVERMSANAAHCKYIVPDKLTVNFKEAIIFALLGALYMFDMPNCLSTVTGAKMNNIGGCLYKAPKK